jgi:hypothetical protein
MNIEKNTDEFWYNKPSILWDSRRLIEFFPNPNLSLSEKLNALVRLSIYLSIILMIFFGNYLYLYIPIVTMGFTFLIYRNYKETKNENLENSPVTEGVLEDSSQLETSLDEYKLVQGECTKPTINNPFMNINEITDKRNKPAACQYYDNENLASDVEKKFEYNLYRDVSDLYNKRNSQRQYYTMPSTTIPNEQTAFAKWLYMSPPTCKEDTIRCVPQTTQPPLPGNGIEYLQLQN